MKRILLIGHNDIRLFLAEKSSWVWLIIVPLLFSFFMGFTSPKPGDPANPMPDVLIENQDEGFLGALFVQELQAQGLNVRGDNQEQKPERAIRIPADFTERVQAKDEVKIEFLKLDESHEPSAAMIELRLWRALIAINAAIVEQAFNVPESQVINSNALSTILARTNAVQVDAQFAGRNPVPVKFNQSLPGNMVMFLMLNLLIFGGSSLADERRMGVLRRLVVHPIRRHELVWGKIYGRFLLGIVQSLIMLCFGQFVLGVPVFRDPVGMLLLVSVYCWTCASLGVLIGATAKNPDKITGLCVLSALLMAAIGGCWWPLEIVPEWLKTMAHAVPTGWAMDGMHQLITFGGTLADIGLELTVLTGFALAASFTAGKLLRY